MLGPELKMGAVDGHPARVRFAYVTQSDTQGVTWVKGRAPASTGTPSDIFRDNTGLARRGGAVGDRCGAAWRRRWRHPAGPRPERRAADRQGHRHLPRGQSGWGRVGHRADAAHTSGWSRGGRNYVYRGAPHAGIAADGPARWLPHFDGSLLHVSRCARRADVRKRRRTLRWWRAASPRASRCSRLSRQIPR